MMPLVLGSWYAAIIFLAYPVLIVIRLSGEERLLLKELPGYGQYREKVKYRIIPFIW
jgi:protein-S-isoprenylcysteine O-methyltransferase Ste14